MNVRNWFETHSVELDYATRLALCARAAANNHTLNQEARAIIREWLVEHKALPSNIPPINGLGVQYDFDKQGGSSLLYVSLAQTELHALKRLLGADISERREMERILNQALKGDDHE